MELAARLNRLSTTNTNSLRLLRGERNTTIMSLSRQEINKRYYQRHREELLARANTPEEKAKKRAYDKIYYKKHSEQKKAISREWRKTHPEEVEEHQKKYRERRIELSKTPKYKATKARSKKKYIMANPEKHRAHIILTNAIASGKITRKPCEVCGNPKVEGHHEDYSKPLKVMWLCHKCHCHHHKERRQNAA